MFNELSLHIEKCLKRGSDFAIAQVVDRVAPSSGKIGDKALILENGEMIGWIGGGCVRGIVIKEALEVMRTRKYRRVRISPEGGTRESSHFKEYVMSCQSKGTVEVLIEPVFPQPEIVVVGKSLIARKLAALGAAADFRVSAMAQDADAHLFPAAHRLYAEVDFSDLGNLSNAYVIVATQGEDDDESVKKALQTHARYVGFLASKAKSGEIREFLLKEGLPEERVARLKSPVGLDINAKLASEVAISILAEIVDDFRKGRATEDPGATKTENKVAADPQDKTPSDQFQEEFYINPVCQVPVSKKNPKHVLEYRGEKVYFCCDGCKTVFEQHPEQYIK